MKWLELNEHNRDGFVSSVFAYWIKAKNKKKWYKSLKYGNFISDSDSDSNVNHVKSRFARFSYFLEAFFF